MKFMENYWKRLVWTGPGVETSSTGYAGALVDRHHRTQLAQYGAHLGVGQAPHLRQRTSRLQRIDTGPDGPAALSTEGFDALLDETVIQGCTPGFGKLHQYNRICEDFHLVAKQTMCRRPFLFRSLSVLA